MAVQVLAQAETVTAAAASAAKDSKEGKQAAVAVGEALSACSLLRLVVPSLLQALRPLARTPALLASPEVLPRLVRLLDNLDKAKPHSPAADDSGASRCALIANKPCIPRGRISLGLFALFCCRVFTRRCQRERGGGERAPLRPGLAPPQAPPAAGGQWACCHLSVSSR